LIDWSLSESDMSIIIESHLTEEKLAAALREMVGSAWVGTQVSLPGSKRRFDMAYERDGMKVLVEFDGDAHYRDTLKIKIDVEKDALAAQHGLRVVRVPYWVQLERVTAHYWFDLEVDIQQSFAHGFIVSKLFPASYCELGVARFKRELYALPESVRHAVVRSMRERGSDHGIEYVFPSELQNISDNEPMKTA
jgi:very-short-patch-repair endonuclease